MRIFFYGACREVTGSNILVEVAGKKILLDCGIFQGSRMAEERNYSPFVFDAKSIDVVVVCHAHLDHTGRLPKLVKDGFRGKIYATAPTAQLTELVLDDSEKLMREESQRDNHPPLYGPAEIETTMELFTTIPYDEGVEISPGIKITLKNAGHILGSSVLILETEGKTLVYTSDLGNAPSELLSPPERIEKADFVISETTYGGRVHEDITKRHAKLNSIINSTISENGVLMIPTFAIERTQELLHDIEHFCTIANCTIPTFYLDSPLAEKVTRVFQKYPEYLNPRLNLAHDNDIFGLSRLRITSTVDASKQIDDAPNPKIIIAGSGMMNGGRILYHLQNYIGDANSTLLIVSYQSGGTLGRRLIDGEKVIKIFGKKYNVAANVVAIGSYSAHADAPQLLRWLSTISGVKKIFLVHGEGDQALAFGESVKEKMGVDVIIPQQGEMYEL
ncbi:MBL fold metallo-hydrolase [Candidatus Curtissbacteria bacterium]|nr:MBL fold metallo-hydrolase [Candidatus Curtissbacteria bacterium]